jgi:uncharacterized GH25 family protein
MFRFAKKRLLSLAVASVAFSFLLGSSSVYAHDFWVNASAPKKDLVKAEIGYDMISQTLNLLRKVVCIFLTRFN